MKTAISKKNTLFGSELQFALIIWTEIGPTCAPKNSKKGIITLLAKKTLYGSLRIDNLTRKAINEINSSKKGFIQKFERHRCICKKR
jgi:hypothetical protein